MAIDWMDNFNIYGTDGGRDARLLNGVYAETTRATLQVDPDPTAGGTMALQKFSGGLGGDMRKVLSAAVTTVGVAARYWLTSIPSDSGAVHSPSFIVLSDVNNVAHIRLSADASGNLRALRNDNGGEVQIAITASPVIIANAWKHIETKCFLDAAAGTLEVRIEGVPVLTFAGRTASNIPGAIVSCQQVAFRSGWDGPNMYVKDFIIWNGTGAANTDFLGSCQVMKIIPDADVALNWTPSAGVTGYNLINEVTPDDDGSYIAAPFPIPAAYKCSLSDLPVTVTSVKGVMPIHRSRKTDGGDGNIQVGAISGGSTGLGADRPITTAYTYWWDVFDRDPNGNIAWTRLAVNAMNLQLNRTL